MRVKIVMMAALMQVGCAHSSSVVEAAPPIAVGADARELSRCFEAQRKVLPFEGVVSMRRGDQLFESVTGFADEDRRVPLRSDSRFRLGSVSKLITRAAIGRLVADGRLAFDAPIGRYVKGLPAPMSQVTIEQLLNHRSGIAALEEIPEGPDLDLVLGAKRASDLLPLLTKYPLEFQPGTKAQYSNGGFNMLGIVIEAVTGRTYSEFVADAVYHPLGMDHSSSTAEGRFALPITSEGLPAGSPPRRYAHWDRVGLPSGNTVSTSDDLMKLADALMSDGFLPDEVKKRAFPRDTPVDGYAQLGGSAGVNTALIASTATGWRLVVLSNRDAPNAEVMAFVLAKAAGILGSPECLPMATPPSM